MVPITTTTQPRGLFAPGFFAVSPQRRGESGPFDGCGRATSAAPETFSKPWTPGTPGAPWRLGAKRRPVVRGNHKAKWVNEKGDVVGCPKMAGRKLKESWRKPEPEGERPEENWRDLNQTEGG